MTTRFPPQRALAIVLALLGCMTTIAFSNKAPQTAPGRMRVDAHTDGQWSATLEAIR